MPHATVDGIRISYDDLGAGEPALVFTTGWCSSRHRWQRVAELCSARRRVLNTEWRGHGDSDPAPSDFGLEEMIADVLGVVDEAGVERFVPCAASHSGFVAIELRPTVPGARAAPGPRRLVRDPAAAAVPRGARAAHLRGRLAGRARQAL